MLKITPYYYYSKNDSKKEAIDKIFCTTIEVAIEHFSERKNMNQADFLSLYIVESYEKTKPE
mgnify:FL=1